MFVQAISEVRRVDVVELFDGNLDGVEAPSLEPGKQTCRFVSERTRKEEGVNPKAHGGSLFDQRARVSGCRLAVGSQLTTGPEQTVGQKAEILRRSGRLQIMAQGRAEDKSTVITVSPANDVFTAILRAFDLQQLMRLGLDRDRLIKLIARHFPNLRKGKCDGAFRIELYD